MTVIIDTNAFWAITAKVPHQQFGQRETPPAFYRGARWRIWRFVERAAALLSESRGVFSLHHEALFFEQIFAIFHGSGLGERLEVVQDVRGVEQLAAGLPVSEIRESGWGGQALRRLVKRSFDSTVHERGHLYCARWDNLRDWKWSKIAVISRNELETCLNVFILFRGSNIRWVNH